MYKSCLFGSAATLPMPFPDLGVLHLDLETRGTADLRKTGSDAYAQHPETDVVIACYAFDDEEVETWFGTPCDFYQGDALPCPERIRKHVEAGGKVAAHNYTFERDLWTHVLGPRYGWPDIHDWQWDCTAVRASAMSLPRSLDGAAGAMGLKHQKDQRGYRVMMQLCKPRRVEEDGTVVWWKDPEKYRTLERYCVKDVEVERELDSKLWRLRESEREVMVVDMAINSRGVKIDAHAAKLALQAVNVQEKALNKRMSKATKYKVSAATQVAKLMAWCADNGCKLESLDKQSIKETLERDDLRPEVREALSVRQEAAKSSTKKLEAMLRCASPDSRARGLHIFLGAGSTGRWSGYKIQTQNMPRGSSNPEAIFPAILTGCADTIELMWGPPLQVISDCLRGFLTADEGNELFVIDFAQIEARILAQLAGQDDKVGVFLRGEDVYCHTATGIYGYTVNKQDHPEERQLGKVADLALGYQMGTEKFQKTAWDPYGIELTEERADSIKKRWRESNYEIVNFWDGCGKAAMRAVSNKGGKFEAGCVSYKVVNGVLTCKLPSGRILCYPSPRIDSVKAPWGDMIPQVTYMGVNSTTKKWERMKLYGGLAVENIVQATAADCLRDSMVKLERAGYPIVMHVHDEVVVEGPKGEFTLAGIEAIMREIPDWAKEIGWPEGLIDVEGFGPVHRYRK